MENPISSDTLGYLAALLTLTLFFAASVPARLDVGAQVMNRCNGVRHGAHPYEPHGKGNVDATQRPHDVGPGATVAGNYPDWSMWTHCAPVPGKEYTPC